MNDVLVEKGSVTVDSILKPVEATAFSSHVSGVLPTGYLDQDGVLHKSIDIRPYTGAEEDILASDKMPFYRRVGKVLEDCILKIGDITDPKQVVQAVRKLVFSDRLYAMVLLRIATNGPVYTFEMSCPECGKKSMQNIDLNDLIWHGLPDPMKRQGQTALPSGKTVRWNVMDGAREERANLYSMHKDLLSIGIFARANDINGKQVTMDMIKALSPKERRMLREDFQKIEGRIDDEHEFECKECLHQWKSDVDLGQMSFFFPTDA